MASAYLDKLILPDGTRCSEFALSGTAGVTAHGALTGLLNDDHPQYVKVDGTRAMSGNLTINKSIPALALQRTGSDSATFSVNSNGDAFLRGWDGNISIGAANSTKDVVVGYVGAKTKISNDCHFGTNSGYIKDNSGDMEIHLATGKKLKIVVG